MKLQLYSRESLEYVRCQAELRRDWALAIRVTVELDRRRKAKLANEGAA